MKTKMRITTLTPELIVVQDRLIDMDIELTMGPKEKHKGPLRVEVTLRDKEDIKKFNTYITKLTDDLPIPDKKKYSKVAKFDGEPIKELLEEVTVKCKTVEQKVTYLRERGFLFVTAQFLSDKGMNIKIKEKHLDYQFLIRRIKEAKNPINDKYDPQLVIGIKFMPKKSNEIKIYLYNNYERSEKAIWKDDKSINFKKIVAKVFPHYMIAEEREKYRLEEILLDKDPERKPSKFLLRWKPAVIEANK